MSSVGYVCLTHAFAVRLVNQKGFGLDVVFGICYELSAFQGLAQNDLGTVPIGVISVVVLEHQID